MQSMVTSGIVRVVPWSEVTVCERTARTLSGEPPDTRLTGRTLLNHLAGTSRKDHDTWPFTAILGRLTLDQRRVSMLSKCQGKHESLGVFLTVTKLVTAAYAKPARQYTQNYAPAKAEVLISPRETPTIQLQLSISRLRNKDWAAFHLHQWQPLLT